MKFLIKYLGVFISILVVLVEALKETVFKDEPAATWIIASILSVTALFNYWLTVWSPSKLIEAAREKRWERMDSVAKELSSSWKSKYGFDISFNLMIPKRRLFYRLRPKTIRFFPRIFKVVWEYGSDHVNSRLRLATDQGLAGRAFQEEKGQAYDVEGMIEKGIDIEREFYLTPEQVHLTKAVKMLGSYPIFEIHKSEESRTPKLIGILNIECLDEGSGILIKDDSIKAEMHSNISLISVAYMSAILN